MILETDVKNRGFVILSLLLICGLCSAVSAEEKAIGLQGTGLATTSEGGQKWALVVGINEYSNVPALRYASADAKGLYNALIKAGFPADNIMLMTDAATGPMYPTRGNLRARINQIATLVEKEDVLVVFFSGHGTEKNGAGYLVPIDGSTTDISSLVPLSWVKETLETSPAKHRLLILDACHSGAKAADAGDSPARVLLEPLGGAAFATISSCDVDQLSYENEQSKHGVFTETLIEGLKGAADKQAQGNNDNIVNATELWAYAALKTRQWSIRSGKVQTPVLRGNFKGLIEIARFKSLEALKAQKEKLRKKLEMAEQLNRNSAAEELRKEIAKLESQLNTIGSGVGDITGSDEVQLAYARYDAAEKQVEELEKLLAETLKIYQPTSTAITKIKERISIAEVELQNTLDAKYQADAIMYESLQAKINAKQANYKELVRDMLPTAPQAKKIATEIKEIERKQIGYKTGYTQIKISELLSFAYANDNKADGKEAIKALEELLTLSPGHSEALTLQQEIIRYYVSAGDVITNSIGMKLVYIPAGDFIEGRYNRSVKISKGFWMGQTEVTQAQYRAIMATDPSYFRGNNLPVDSVYCFKAMKFCKKLSQKENGRVYTLPTDKQWEYACRAGTTTVYSFGNSDSGLGSYAWYYSNSGKKTHPVGRKKPNKFGLYDMHGNMWEWARDSAYGNVLRGGGWNISAEYCRSAYRLFPQPMDWSSSNNGFRVVSEVEINDIIK